MATSYTLKSHSYDGRYMYLSCTQTKDIATNTSKIAWKLTVTGGDDKYYTTGPTTVKINGTTVYYKARTAWSNKVFPAATGSISGNITVSHDNNGEASIPVSIKTDIYYNKPKTTSGTWTLDPNERFATIDSAPNFNDEENPTITYSNPAGDSVTLLRACISLDGNNDDVTYRDIDKNGTSYTFELTEAERDVLRAATTANSRTVKFYIRSEIGGSYKGSNLERIFTIKNPNPTINPTIVDSNSTTVGLTGDSSVLVKYHSNANVTIGAAAVKKASLASQKVTCGNGSLTADGTFSAVENNRFVFAATDSRGNTTTITKTPSFVEYVKLTCTLANNLPQPNGTMTVKASGKYFNGSFGAKSNDLTVYYRYKIYGGSYPDDWAQMTVTFSDNAYFATASIDGLDYKTAYVFQAYAVDALETVYSAERAAKATPVFDWGENDFKFNVPVYDEHATIIRNGLAAYTGSGDAAIDPNTTLEHLCLTNKNTPTAAFYYVHTSFYNTKSDTTNRTQKAYPYNASSAGSYTRYMANGTWSAWENDALAAYPIGSHYISSTNTSPASLLGGTWKLVKKEFVELTGKYNIGDSDCPFTPNSTNCSGGKLYLLRSGQGMRLRIDAINAVELTDTSVTLGTLNWNSLGIADTYLSFYGETASSDTAQGAVIATLNCITGDLVSVDINPKTDGGSIAASTQLYFPFNVLVTSDRMLDEHCDKFYWQRTA